MAARCGGEIAYRRSPEASSWVTLRRMTTMSGAEKKAIILRSFAAATIVFLTVFGVFFPATFGEWLEWDDTVNFVQNDRYRGLSLENLRWMFTTFHLGHYQPLSWITLAIDYSIWGMNPVGYHLTNQLLHAISAVLVFAIAGVVLRLVKAERGDGASTVRDQFVAVLIALVWAVHPMRVESVAWVTERRDVLSSCFWLSAVYLYLLGHGAARGRESGAAHRGLIVAAWLAIVLSLLSRAIGITFPVILLILDWRPLKRIGGDRGWFSRAARGVWVEKLIFAVPAIGAALVAPLAQQSASAVMTLADHSPVARVAQACYGLVFYVWKTLLPIGLSPFHEIDTPLKVASIRYLIPIGLVMLTAAALLIYRRRAGLAIIAAGIFVVVVSPVLGFLQSGRQEVAYRYSYLPTVALITLGGLCIDHWARRRGRAAGVAAVVGGGIAIVILVGLTFRQIGVWRNSKALWTEAFRVEPSSTTNQTNYGYYVLLAEGRAAEAAKCFERAIALRSDNELAHENLWLALDRLGRADDLEKALSAALAIPAVAPNAHAARGNLSLRYGDQKTAEAEYEAALRLRPTYADPAIALSNILLRGGRRAEAERHIRMLETRYPLDPRVRELSNQLNPTDARENRR
ncbi:MAG: tetratricopeptide repeat protein [Phycisphaerales bacterium]|nr:tetratricopeptide repeat protein [Phycisphaerales bacterium]